MRFLRKRAAIFIDMDNLSVPGLLGVTENLGRWMRWLEDGAFASKAGRRRFVIKQAFWNGSENRRRPAFESEGFAAVPCRPQAQKKRMANDSAVDLAMAVAAMDLCAHTPGLKEVFLFSADSDFVVVARALQRRGLKVIAVADETNATSAIWREFADHVIEFVDLRAAFGYGGRKKPPLEPLPPERQTTPPWMFEDAQGDRPARPIRRLAPAIAPRDGAIPRPKAPPKAQPALAPVVRADLTKVAETIAAAAATTPDQPMTRLRVLALLEGEEGFSDKGRAGWLGFGDYKEFIKEVLRLRPVDLESRTFENGQVSVFPKRPPPPTDPALIADPTP